MKILYGAENRIGAGIQLEYFKHACNNKHKIRCAAFSRSFNLTYVDWSLNSLQASAPKSTRQFASDVLFKDLKNWKPDLVISDAEPITANIASQFEIPLWYCSPLHLADGVNWEREQHKYSRQISDVKREFQEFPEADRYFICSPFGDISMRPLIKNDYEWIKPYCSELAHYMSTDVIRSQSASIEIIKDKAEKYNLFVCTGETPFVAKCFYEQKPCCILSDPNSPESLINSSLCEYYGVGIDMGQIELSIHYLKEQLERAREAQISYEYLSVQNKPQLHEVL